ncbi:MAG: hypothetical protein ABDK93_07880 [Atribacterota bacterium]
MTRMPRLLPQPNSWGDYVEEFLLEKRLSGVSERTLRDYQFHLSKFFDPIRKKAYMIHTL